LLILPKIPGPPEAGVCTSSTPAPAEGNEPPDDHWERDEEDRRREPLPAGDRRSWGAITAGTLLEGMAYPLPVFER
jgi:hypothetical protein